VAGGQWGGRGRFFIEQDWSCSLAHQMKSCSYLDWISERRPRNWSTCLDYTSDGDHPAHLDFLGSVVDEAEVLPRTADLLEQAPKNLAKLE